MEKKEAMKILKDFYDKSALFSIRTALDTIIPQLKESEDEKIREVEPKFKIGDIITNGKIIGKVDENENNKYHGWFGYDKDLSVYYADIPDIENWRLWTIQDAKDGDILAAHECLVLFREIDGLNIRCYCTYHFMNNPSFYVDTLQNKDAFHPATKEQCDKLEKAMTEAGYEWDAEKKELKKIEQKPADVESKFHEGNLVIVSTAEGDRVVQIASVEYLKDGHPSYFTTGGRWFGNGTKARLLSDKDVETITLPESKIIVSQNPAWSEEDEYNFAFIQEALLGLDGDDSYREKCCKMAEWLESLKGRYTWKPSDEQMERLKGIINSLPHQEVLYSLYQDLKNLKG